jgi:hypothetical protein
MIQRMAFPPILSAKFDLLILKRGPINPVLLSAMTQLVASGRVGANPPDELTRFPGFLKKSRSFSSGMADLAFFDPLT